MNTETRRHDEKSAYHRKSKYPDDPMGVEELVEMDEESGGVLDDWKDAVEPADEPEPEVPAIVMPAPKVRRPAKKATSRARKRS